MSFKQTGQRIGKRPFEQSRRNLIGDFSRSSQALITRTAMNVMQFNDGHFDQSNNLSRVALRTPRRH